MKDLNNIVFQYLISKFIDLPINQLIKELIKMKNNTIILKQREKGEEIRKEILKELPNTIYSLSKQFKLNPSTIRYHLSILEGMGFINSIEMIKNNRVSLCYYLNNKENSSFLHLFNEFFNAITDKVYVYALTDNSIGVSTEPDEEWASKSIWSTFTDFERKNDMLLIKVPEKIKNHYNIPFGILDPAYSEDKKTAIFSLGSIGNTCK